MKIDLSALSSPDPKIKYGFAKELLEIAINEPYKLYSNFQDWVDLLDSEKNILKWTAIDILAYLSYVDKDNLVPAITSKLIEIFKQGSLITTNHCSFALLLIAKNKPEIKDKLIDEIVGLKDIEFDTEECKNIAIGKIIDYVMQNIDTFGYDKRIIRFIVDEFDNSRNATKKKVVKYMKKTKYV